MALQWRAADLRTGIELCELPDLSFDSVTRTIGQYESTTATLPISGESRPPPLNWMRATAPYRSVLFAVDPVSSAVRWAGIVTGRVRAGDGKLQLNLATAESYTERRFLRATLQYKQVDRLLIAQDLLTRFVVDGAGGKNGLPLRIVVDGAGQLADGDYKDTDDKTVYSALQDLGLEWTFDVEYLPNPTRIRFVALLSERLGVAAPAGMQPAVGLDWPGNLAAVSVTQDYSDGSGANDVLATSTGQGDVRPQSDPTSAVPGDMVTVERRYSPGSNIVTRATLNADAQAELASIVDGTTSYAFVISQNQPTSVNNPTPVAFSFGLGDDIGYDIGGEDFPEHLQGIARVVSIQMDASTLTPALAGPDTGE